jgi:hypothetical protein
MNEGVIMVEGYEPLRRMTCTVALDPSSNGEVVFTIKDSSNPVDSYIKIQGPAALQVIDTFKKSERDGFNVTGFHNCLVSDDGVFQVHLHAQVPHGVVIPTISIRNVGVSGFGGSAVRLVGTTNAKIDGLTTSNCGEGVSKNGMGKLDIMGSNIEGKRRGVTVPGGIETTITESKIISDDIAVEVRDTPFHVEFEKFKALLEANPTTKNQVPVLSLITQPDIEPEQKESILKSVLNAVANIANLYAVGKVVYMLAAAHYGFAPYPLP